MFRHVTVVLAVLVLQGCLGEDWHFTGPDVALHMDAEQGPGTFLNYVADLAVDGNHDNNIQHNHCSHTDNETGGWWKVQLPDSFFIKGVRIYNRFNNPERLKDFRVVGNPGNVEVYNDKLVPEGSKLYLQAVINITVTADKPFSSVEVNIPGPYLTLCEVEIYTELCKLPVPPSGSALKFEHTGNTYQNDSVYVGSQLYFHCEPQSMYLMVGNDTLTCLADGSYSSDMPKCVKYCPRPPPVNNGNYSDERTNYINGDTIWMNCYPNFSSRTDSKQTCTSDSTWSEPNPTCSIITCPRPEFMTHGYYLLNNGSKLTFGNVDVGTTVSVVCEKGFVSPYPNLQCASNGAWTRIGECLNISSIRCSLDSLRPNEHFYMLNGSYPGYIGYDVTITSSCQTGYVRNSGDYARTCLANQSLNGTELVCIAINCSLGLLHPEERHYILDKNYGGLIRYNETVDATCKPGYMKKSGDSIRKCLADQSLSGTELQCIAINCSLGSLHPKERHYVLDKQYGDHIRYTETIDTYCEPGYMRTSGDTARKCLADQSLSGTELLCIAAVNCSLESLQPTEHFYKLDRDYGDFLRYNTSINATCVPGYERKSGDFARTCLLNTSLSGTELVCTAIINCSLESLRPAEHFYKLDRDYGGVLRHNTSLSATCVTGYERESGDFVRTCLLNTSLTGTELVCAPIPNSMDEMAKSKVIVSALVGSVLVNLGLSIALVLYILRKRLPCNNTKDTCQTETGQHITEETYFLSNGSDHYSSVSSLNRRKEQHF